MAQSVSFKKLPLWPVPFLMIRLQSSPSHQAELPQQKISSASGGNTPSIGHLLMKAWCHSLKKQLIIFSHQSISPLQARLLQVIYLSGFLWAGSSNQMPLRKGGSWGKEQHGLSFILAGVQVVHWDRLTSPAAPMGDGMSCGDNTCYLTAFDHPHQYTNSSTAGYAVIKCRLSPATAGLSCWHPDMALEEPSLDAEGRAGPGWEHKGFSLVVVWMALHRDCKGPPRHAGLPPPLLSSSPYSQGPGLGWYNIYDLAMQGMTFKEKKELLNTS